MSHKQKTLWTKDFTSITIATILTAVGGEAMNLPISRKYVIICTLII